MRQWHSGRAACDVPNNCVAPPGNYVPLPPIRLGGPGGSLDPKTARQAGQEDLKQYRTEGPNSPKALRRWCELLESGERPRALVLTEPTTAQLIYLDALLGLEERLANGLELVLVGPPLYRPDVDWPTWLDWTAEPASAGGGTATETLQIYRDARVYFCPDNSATAQKTIDANGAKSGNDYTPLHAQADVIRRVYELLEARVPDPATGKPLPPAEPVRLASIPAPPDPKGPGQELQNVYHTALLGLDGPAFGKNGITLYPPLTQTFSHRSAEDRSETPFTPEVESGASLTKEAIVKLASYRDLMMSHTGARLQAIIAPPEHPARNGDRRAFAELLFGESFEPLRFPHLYPNAAVVLFTLDHGDHAAPAWDLLPTVTRRRFEDPNGKAERNPFNRELPHRISDLARMGVAVFVVRIEFGTGMDHIPANNHRLLEQLGKEVLSWEELVRVDPKPGDLVTNQSELVRADLRLRFGGGADPRADARAAAETISTVLLAPGLVPMIRRRPPHPWRPNSNFSFT
jgi:hypothetical protein